MAKRRKKKSTWSIVLNVILVAVASYLIFSGWTNKFDEKDEPQPADDVTDVEQMDEDTEVIAQEKTPYKVEITFDPALLGDALPKTELIVLEQDAEVSGVIDMSKMKNTIISSLLKKTKKVIYHGKARYTVDLKGIGHDPNTLQIDNHAETITVHIPEPELSVEYLPKETEFYSTDNGWLRFGEIQITPELNTRLEEEAVEKIKDKIESDPDSLKNAEEIAVSQVKDMYEPIVKEVEDAAVKAKNDPLAIPINFTIHVVVDSE